MYENISIFYYKNEPEGKPAIEITINNIDWIMVLLMLKYG